MDRRRLENLVAPVAVVAVVGLVVALFALRSDPEPQADQPTAAPSETSAPTTSPTPTVEPDRDGQRPPRRKRLPQRAPLGSRLPDPNCTEAPVRTRSVDVVTYNIKAGRDSGRGLAGIAAELRSWEPDIVLMQEVDRFRNRTGGTDQPAALAAQLGPDWSWSFGANVVERRGAFSGTAILTRFPIVEDLNTSLPNQRGGQQRGLLGTRVRIGGEEVSVYNTHLEPRRPYAGLRVRQSGAVRRIVEADDAPALLGGDFNTGPGTAPLRVVTGGRMTDSWSAVGSGPGHTVPAGRAVARIDFLLHSEEFVPVSAQVLTGSSDHRAVRASYEIETGSACLPPGSVN